MIGHEQDYAYLRELIRERSGIELDDSRMRLLRSHAATIARDSGCSTVTQLVERVRRHPGGEITDRIIEAVAIHETRFFRDERCFDALRDTLLPALIESRRAERRLSFWAAACSTGQEPYSLAMLLDRSFPECADWSVEILASDFSIPALARAREGFYSDLETGRGLPDEYRSRYFTRERTGWRIRPEIRDRVEFRVLNLAERWPAFPPVDMLLIRNVLIYFNRELRRSILERCREQLRADGTLVIGGPETIAALDCGFRAETHHGFMFCRPDGPAAPASATTPAATPTHPRRNP